MKRQVRKHTTVSSFSSVDNDGVPAFQTQSSPPSMRVSARLSAGRRHLVVGKESSAVIFLKKSKKNAKIMKMV
jgi:hypothetical protein